MSIVQHIKVLDSQLANIKIVAGSTIYTRDTGKHFIDISDTERVQISDIIYIDTDKERTALLAPLPDKLYITRDTNKVWIYSVKSDKWVCLNIDTTYTAGTGISIDGTTINNSGVRAVTAGASANKININTNGNTNTITIDNVANATSAGKATNDSAGQQINTTYIKGLSVSGKVITYTKGDGTTGTITTQDTDTWRGIQNVLTSDSTTDSLSAAQGKALKGLVDGKADKATTLSGYGINDAYTKTEVDNKVNVRSSSTLPDDAPDGTIIINPDEGTNVINIEGKADKATTLAGYGITDSYTKTEVDNKVNVRSSSTLPDDAPDGTIIINPDENTNIINIDGKADKATTLAGYGINDAYTKTETDNKVNVRSSSTLPENAPDGTIIINPDEDTNVINMDEYVKASEANTWTANQTMNSLSILVEKYHSSFVSGTSDNPEVSTMIYTATGAFTLDLSSLASKLSNNQAMVFSAYFKSTADYTLSITNAGTIKYIGSASDVAISSSGMLLNILMVKDESDNLTSIVQANKLS